MSSPVLSSDESATLRCARHPATETVLRCGRCDTPICPRCLVTTPVGARCPSCARVKRFTLLLKPRELALAVAYGTGAAAIGTAIVLAVVMRMLGPLIGFAIVGFAVGEAVSIGANRKRARELGPVAVACLFVGYELGAVILLVSTAGVPPRLDIVALPIYALGERLIGVG
jgi:hypothetical protein